MAEIKWIKITTNMFDDEKIKLIDAMPERDTIHYIWVRLLVQAGKTNANGYIFLNENIPYTDEMLSTIFNRPLNSVRLALKILNEFGMIEVAENNLIKITNWEKHQNVEGMEKVREQNRIRKQKQRGKEKKLLQDSKEEICGTKKDGHSMSRDSHAIEIDTEIDRDIDKDKEIDTEIDSNYVAFFNNNFHLISPYEKEILESFEKDGLESKLITLALQKALDRNKRSIDYVKGILNNWLKDNIKTVEQAKIKEKEYQKNKGGGKNGNSEQCTKELEDEGLGFTV